MADILTERMLSCEAWDRGGVYEAEAWRIYPFATESIANYIKYFNLKGKSLLTVGSSGDQVINAALYGCKDITLFDMVPDAIYYYYLKVAGLISLSMDEFLKFFRYYDFDGSARNLRVFNKESYEKLRDTLRLLNYESFLYFDEFFSNFSGDTIRRNFFKGDENSNTIIKRINPYLSSNIDYENAKEKVKKIDLKFICKNILDIDSEKTYDNIWLSNVADYLRTHEQEMIMTDKTYKCLNQGGKLLLSYNFSISKEREKERELYKSLLQLYGKSLVKVYDFPSVPFPNFEKDNVLILKK